MKTISVMLLASLVPNAALATGAVQSKIVPLNAALAPDQIQLMNDSFGDVGGQAYLESGFVAGEKAGVWVQVPATIPHFKIDSFRVLLGSSLQLDKQGSEPMDAGAKQQVFFAMEIADQMSAAITGEINNAADITPGSYWNDIPAEGTQGKIRCAKGGQFVGAALEFTHPGVPSVYRDLDGITAPKNLLFAIPGGWNLSVVYGLRGDWILRVVGHAATPAECAG